LLLRSRCCSVRHTVTRKLSIFVRFSCAASWHQVSVRATSCGTVQTRCLHCGSMQSPSGSTLYDQLTVQDLWAPITWFRLYGLRSKLMLYWAKPSWPGYCSRCGCSILSLSQRHGLLAQRRPRQRAWRRALRTRNQPGRNLALLCAAYRLVAAVCDARNK
jgi:hypothetical protein